MLVGAPARDFIKEELFDPWVVCTTLILGGFVLLAVDQLRFAERFPDATRFPLPMYLKIGAIQCLAMVPGVSRSGATIVGAMTLGADKRAAAEFSFFLAIPTMAGAFAYDLLKNYKLLSVDDLRADRGRLRRRLRHRPSRGPHPPRLRLAPRLRGVRLVADRRRRGGLRGAPGLWLSGRSGLRAAATTSSPSSRRSPSPS